MYRATPIDPQLQAAADAIPPELGLITQDMVAPLRAGMAQQIPAATKPTIRVDTRWQNIAGEAGDSRVVVYRPLTQREAGPGLLWIHGGGYLFGSADEILPAQLAEKYRCTVVSVDYRLAPEHPFPAGLEDCLAAYHWMLANAVKLAIDPTIIALAGQSAGGGLAAGLALKLRDSGACAPAFQFLLYPMLDNLHATPSGQHVDHYVWNRQTSLNAWAMYLNGTPGAVASPYAAAARATDLSGLPPTFVTVGTADLFRDECIDYAHRLMAAEVAVELVVFPGVFHGAEQFAPEAQISRRMNSCIDEAFGRFLGSGNS